MKDLMSITEFSKISGIEPSTLRYWDDVGLFTPIARDPNTHYRYYSAAQLIPLNFITVLSDINVSLKTISDLDNDRDPERFIQLIDQQEKALNLEMRKLRISYAIIHARRELISYGLKVERVGVSIMNLEERQFILGPQNEYGERETFIDALTRFVVQAKEMRINLSFPVGGYHKSLESFIKTPKQPDRFFSMDPTGNHKLSAGVYLAGFTNGDYGEFGDTPDRMFEYLEENELQSSGPVYTMYLLDEICIKDPSLYLAQSCVAVSKKEVI